jgi:hypothetical protein
VAGVWGLGRSTAICNRVCVCVCGGGCQSKVTQSVKHPHWGVWGEVGTSGTRSNVPHHQQQQACKGR